MLACSFLHRICHLPCYKFHVLNRTINNLYIKEIPFRLFEHVFYNFACSKTVNNKGLSVPFLFACIKVRFSCSPASSQIYTTTLDSYVLADFVFFFSGAIPGPIILGSAIDATCVVWGKGCEEGMTSCWIYDNQLLGRNVCIFTTSVNFGAYSIWLLYEKRKVI